MKINFEPSKVTVLRGLNGGVDRIMIKLPDEIARQVHGNYYLVWREAYLDMQVTRGQAEDALKALGIDPQEAEFIQV